MLIPTSGVLLAGFLFLTDRFQPGQRINAGLRPRPYNSSSAATRWILRIPVTFEGSVSAGSCEPSTYPDTVNPGKHNPTVH
jgi:hypothetical protein